MGFMNEIGSLLQRYQGASASAPPNNVEQDFRHVAPQVPQSAVAKGLSDAFTSHELPPFGQMVSQLFSQSNGEQRDGILNHLIGPRVTSSSVFAGVTPGQARQVSPETVQNLAEHARAQDPSIVR